MDFQTALSTTRPKLNTKSPSDEMILAPRLDSDCDVVYMSTSPKRKKKGPPTEGKPDNNIPPTKARNGPEYKTEVFSRWMSPGRPWTLDEIRMIKEKSHRAGIPNHIDSCVIDAMNMKSVKHWKDITTAFVDAVHGIVREALMTTLNEILVQYHQTNLYRELHRIIDDFLVQLRTDYLDTATAHYRIEYETPFTMAHDQHRQGKQLALQALSRGREQSRIRCYRVLRGYSDDDDLKASKVIDELGEDPFSQEVEMMAVCVCTFGFGSGVDECMLIM